jgi:uncharacterized protein
MRFSLRNTFIILLLWLTLSTLAVSVLPQCHFSYDIERFFNPDDPELKEYHEFRSRFENDNDFVIIGIRNRGGLFNTEFLDKVDSLTINLSKLSHVVRVQSPLNLYEYVFDPFQAGKRKLINRLEPEQLSNDSLRIFGSAFWSESFFSKDRHSLLIHIKKQEGTDRTQNEQLYNEIHTLLNNYQFNEYHIAGRIRTQHYYINGMFAEMSKLSVLALVVLITVVWLMLRWFWAVVLVPLIMVSSVIGALAIVAVSGIPLNLLMVLMPVFIIITGMSAGIHLISRFRSNYTLTEGKEQVLNRVFRELGGLNLFATLTTSLGFFSLYFMPSEPVKLFGLFTGAGVLYTYFISSLVVPAVLRLLPAPKSKKEFTATHLWKTKLWEFISRHHKKVIACSIVTCIIFSIPLYKVKVNTQFLDDVNKQSDLYHDLSYFEKEFSGIRPLEISVRVNNPDLTVLSLPVLLKLDSLEQFLRAEFGAGFILSPVTLMKTAKKAKTNGNEKGYRLSSTHEGANELADIVLNYSDSTLRKLFIAGDLKHARISAKMPDFGSRQMKIKRDALNHYIVSKIPPGLMEVKLTGAAALMDKSADSISLSMVYGILLNLVLFVVLMFFITRSIIWALLSIIPNLLPLLLCAGIMGIAGIELKAFTSVVFTIILGIAVDDTIHLMGKSIQLIRKKLPGNEALKQSWISLFFPTIYTSLTLSAGFLVLAFSEFPSSNALGVLLAMSLIAAMLLDLLLTPTLLIAAQKHIKKYGKYDS